MAPALNYLEGQIIARVDLKQIERQPLRNLRSISLPTITVLTSTRNLGQARARQESGCRSFKLKPLFAAEAQQIEHEHDDEHEHECAQLRNLRLIIVI